MTISEAVKKAIAERKLAAYEVRNKVHAMTGLFVSESAVTARLRELRSEKFGSHKVNGDWVIRDGKRVLCVLAGGGMNYREVYFDSGGREAVNSITNAPDEWEPHWAADSRAEGSHKCYIVKKGSAYQCCCACGLRFGVHNYELAELGAQTDAAVHRMNYGISNFRISEMDGIDYKLCELAWCSA